MKEWCKCMEDKWDWYYSSSSFPWEHKTIMFCPKCGTPRPKESKVELPEKLASNIPDSCEIKRWSDKLIDYLATKPWETK